jgi:16S rRNA (adenine1518-N6/adenine1519-N6)-dimethyltransferase
MPRARKRFGQHFLEAGWADKLLAAIDPQPADRFLEIGAGPGALTMRLASRAAHVTAIEVDREMVAALTPELPSNVALIQADFLDIDLAPIVAGGPLRIAGNLPYNISSPILFRLIDLWRRSSRQKQSTAGDEDRAPPPPWTDATLMLQREVADRIAATPGSRDYGVLSISVQLHADVRRMLTLPPGAFRPPPKVYSAVVQLRFRPPAVAIHDEQVFEAMVRAMFTQRRKMLANALAPFAIARQADARRALAAAGIDPGRRAETLQLAELARLADYFAGAVPPN